MAMRHFFIERSSITGNTAVIVGADVRHIITVLRMRPGDPITLYDESGMSHSAQINALSRRRIDVSIMESHMSVTESPVQITVGQATLKAGAMDSLVRQLTELGIAEWMPFVAERSIPRPDRKRLGPRLSRWQAISRQALKQCGRSREMKIHPVKSFAGMMTAAEAYDLSVVFYEDEDEPLKAGMTRNHPSVRRILVLIGAEGGFTEREIDQATAAGFIPAGLGPRVLKAGTATVAACSLLQYLFGDMGDQKHLDNK